MKKIILHLCADIGSDSRYYAEDSDYEVIKVGKDIGVENFTFDKLVYGIIANPVCTEFSTAQNFSLVKDVEKGMFLVNHCFRIIKECSPIFWVLENPFNGRLKEFIGNPKFVYQPWEFGSAWTKKTALWGDFKIPEKIYKKWEDVEKIPELYIKRGRNKPGLDCLHKSAINFIDEFKIFKDFIHSDADFRSLCSQKFAHAFKNANL